jgi:hypothetical protein
METKRRKLIIDDAFSEDETERRRDEVIRLIANTRRNLSLRVIVRKRKRKLARVALLRSVKIGFVRSTVAVMAHLIRPNI